MDDARRPILVGVGQITLRDQSWPDIAGPLDLLCEAVSRAVIDTGAAVLGHVDHLCVANIASWDYANAPAMAAARLGLDERAELVQLPVGGNTPQRAVNDLARRLAAGEIDVAIVAGGEAFAGKRTAKKAGQRVDWGTHPGRLVPPPEADPSHPVERAHGVEAPSITYPMWEPALRHAAGRTIEEHNVFLGELMARFTEVAAANPYAWFRERRDASELISVSGDNRMIASPYPKRLNAIMRVDQGAAVIMTTVGRAREMGIPTDRWVYLHGGGDCYDLWYLAERTTYEHSPAMRAVAEQAWASSGFAIDDIAHIDFYSCFPSAVQLAADAYGIAPDDARPLTVTGGLAYAGGPGNNYVTNAIATMIERLRDNPGDIGLCTGLGWHVTKHSAGIYSTRPPDSDYTPIDGSADQAAIHAAPHPSVEAEPEGTAVIEAYTVAYGRDGEPEVARCLARLDAERRAVVSSSETAVITALTDGEWYGRSIAVTPDGRFGLLD